MSSLCTELPRATRVPPGTKENLRGRSGWTEKDMGVPWVTLARIGQPVSLPISTINRRPETQATHSPGPGEVLGLMQCPCDHHSACPITRLPLLLFFTVSSHQTWGEGQPTTSPPLQTPWSFMHTESLSSSPQVSQYLTNLDTVARRRTVGFCSPFPSLPSDSVSPSDCVAAGLMWSCDFRNSSCPHTPQSTTTLFGLFCGNLRFCFPLLGRPGTASTRGGDISQE